MSNFAKQFIAARRVSTPLVAVRTPDPASTMRSIIATLKKPTDKEAPIPLLHWCIMNGLVGLTTKGKFEAAKVLEGGQPEMVSNIPMDALRYIAKLGKDGGEDAIIFMANAARFWTAPEVVQGIWNLRDQFKAQGSMLVMLTTTGATLPAELAEDVLVLDEPLPTIEELGAIVADTFKAAEMKPPEPEMVTKATDALIGLSAFTAEQSLSMSLTTKGLDIPAVWERKRQAIEQTPGLSVWRGGESFNDIGGCNNIKKFMGAVLKGKSAPRVVLFLDEVEKAFAGQGTDTSGVKTEMLGTMLTWMQDKEARGSIFIGPPGAAKSAIAKSVGAAAGIPTISFDLAAMQGSLVGESGARLRTALKVVEAVSQGRTLVIATCNKIASLPPELKRRFTLGIFFFDLPTKSERAAIWPIYEQKYSVGGTRPNDEGWTGAEIKECCLKASLLSMTLEESATYIVPVSKSDPESISSLRKQADGRFIGASEPGPYHYSVEESAPTATRKIRKPDVDVMGELGEA